MVRNLPTFPARTEFKAVKVQFFSKPTMFFFALFFNFSFL